jgi:ASC-1-like (ASCH) protein
METYTMHLDKEPFEKMKAGKKTIEVRLYDDKRRKIKPGDEIVFLKLPDNDESIKARVIEIFVFDSFAKMFEAIGPEQFGHDKSLTVEQRVNMQRKYYTEEEEKRYGVVAIKIKTVQN